MDRFSKQISHGDNTFVFQFTRMRNVNGEKYFVTSQNPDKKPFSFSLRQKDNQGWKLTPGSQRWLYDIEAQLSDAVFDTRS